MATILALLTHLHENEFGCFSIFLSQRTLSDFCVQSFKSYFSNNRKFVVDRKLYTCFITKQTTVISFDYVYVSDISKVECFAGTVGKYTSTCPSECDLLVDFVECLFIDHVDI